MAKGLRSKTKRHFRTAKRETVAQAPWQLEAEKKKQELLAEVIAGPKVTDAAVQSGEAGGPVGMDAEEGQQPAGEAGGAMAMDGQPEVTTKNPAKILKKIKKQRLAVVKGIVAGKKKKGSLQKQGASHFLKKKKKH